MNPFLSCFYPDSFPVSLFSTQAKKASLKKKNWKEKKLPFTKSFPVKGLLLCVCVLKLGLTHSLCHKSGLSSSSDKWDLGFQEKLKKADKWRPRDSWFSVSTASLALLLLFQRWISLHFKTHNFMCDKSFWIIFMLGRRDKRFQLFQIRRTV